MLWGISMKKSRFKTPCTANGCKNLTYYGYCDDHKEYRKVYDRWRGNANKRGYDSKWRRYRISFLSSHPFCEECKKKGMITVATVVDHIIPHKGDKKLFWDTKNHQALCESCHNRKTATEDMGTWKA